ncbi:MAG: hypothetical protein ACO3UO_07835 [Burkholderiaceae bacterium]
MTQPINGNPGISAQELANRAAERDRLQQAKQASDAPEKTENKSEDSLQLSGIAEQVSNEPAFDRAKVDAIKQALQKAGLGHVSKLTWKVRTLADNTA